jgi:hypothetical protein
MAIEAATRALSDLPVIAILTSASIACGAYCLAIASISMTCSVFLGRPRGLPSVHLCTTLVRPSALIALNSAATSTL